MKSAKIDQHIRKQVRKLMKQRDTKKVRLGQALGGGGVESRQQYFTRAQRFLEGVGAVKMSVLLILVEFFQKPLSYFLPTTAFYPPQLEKEINQNAGKNKELNVIAENLHKLGFDEEFIKNQLRQLAAMEAYNAGNEKK